MDESCLERSPLGHDVPYPSTYDASVLFPIARAQNREALGNRPAWSGADYWTAYELSWLNPKGKPVIAVARFEFPHDSPFLIESKSFKLYLNSFNESRYADAAAVVSMLKHDLSQAVGAPVDVVLLPMDATEIVACRPLNGESLDGLDVEITDYRPAPHLLSCVADGGVVTETLVSDLLKSNCPVTGQPDWGSVQISYTGPQIDRAGLLKYIVSLRRHDEFHEHCVEQMFCDIWRACQPEALTVYARYTRRGGLDINPSRSSHAVRPDLHRTPRQ